MRKLAEGAVRIVCTRSREAIVSGIEHLRSCESFLRTINNETGLEGEVLFLGANLGLYLLGRCSERATLGQVSNSRHVPRSLQHGGFKVLRFSSFAEQLS